MKRKQWIVLLLLLWACQESRDGKISKISKVYFQSWGCFGECPIMKLEIDSYRNYNYEGSYYTSKRGKYSGVLSQSDYDEILFQINELYKDESIDAPPLDGGDKTIIITFQDNRVDTFNLVKKGSYLTDKLMKVIK